MTIKRSCPWTIIGPNVDKTYSSKTPYWTVAFSPYKDPVSAYAPNGVQAFQSDKLQIVENDAVGISISNSKESFGKTASINLKITNVNYPVLINNGDWVFIWMNETKQKNDEVVSELIKVRDRGSSSSVLSRYDMGLKFVGRVTSTSLSDRVSGGTRVMNSSIQAQAFLDLATSIYYMYSPEAALGASPPPSEQKLGLTSVSQGLSSQAFFEGLSLNKGIDASLQNLVLEFNKIFNSGDLTQRRPDVLIGLLFAMTMGISDVKELTGLNGGVPLTVNAPIQPTKDVFKILNLSGNQIWQTYRLYLGLQKYNPGKNWYTSFAPISTSNNGSGGVIKVTPVRCKGLVQYTPPEWTNRSIWSILNDYLNPVSNEMYTALKLDNSGHLRPTIVVREVPFSTGKWKKIETGLFRVPMAPAGQISNSKDALTQAVPESVSKGISDAQSGLNNLKSSVSAFSNQKSAQSPDNDERTYYGSLPRWVVDEAVVLAFDWATDEASRINFVQIYGVSAVAEAASDNMNQEIKTRNQLQAGNYVIDQLDIQRHGLRVLRMDTPFDFPEDGNVVGSFAPTWAKMQADWNFNGHLKAKGTLTISGTELPVAEGDNLEFRGILFHIDSVTHSASIGQNGVKTWTTTFGLAHGVLAASLADPQGIPMYVTHSTAAKYSANIPGPGLTYVQERESGEAKEPNNPLKNGKFF